MTHRSICLPDFRQFRTQGEIPCGTGKGATRIGPVLQELIQVRPAAFWAPLHLRDSQDSSLRSNDVI